MVSVNYFLKEPKSTKETLIMVFVSFNGSRIKKSIGEKIKGSEWNKSKQRVRGAGSRAEFYELNTRLDRIQSEILNQYRIKQNDQLAINTESIKKMVDEILHPPSTASENIKLVDWIKDEINLMRIDQKKGSIQVYNTLVKHLESYSNKKRTILYFEDIDYSFYDEFKKYLLHDKNLLINTFGKQIKTLKTMLNRALEKEVHSNLKFKSKYFKAPSEKVQSVYLNHKEIELLENLDLSESLSLERVRDLFVIGCHTGLRFSDFSTIRSESIFTEKGKQFLEIKTIKTGEKIVVPLKTEVSRVLDRYNGGIPKAISNQKMNKYLKEVCKIAGIGENVLVSEQRGNKRVDELIPKHNLITTHTARRSFATNAYLAGIPAQSIMKFTGHKTERSFLIYLKLSEKENAINLADHPFFK